MKRPSLRGNILSMVVLQLSNYVIPLLTFPYLTRILGVTNFGTYALAFAVTTYLVLVTDWGFPLTASAQIARAGSDREEISRIFWATIAAKAVLGLVMVAGVLGAAVMVPQLRAVGLVLLCASGMVVANVVTVGWCLQGLERLGKFASAAAIGRALTVPATFLLVHGSGDAWIAALIQSGGALIGGMLSILLLVQLRVIGAPNASPRQVITQLREAWPLFLSAISVNLYTTTNTVLLGVLHGPAQVGLFSGADRLRAAAQSAIAPISQAVYPRASRLMHEDEAGAFLFARRLLWMQGLFTLAITLALAFGASPLIWLLAGPGFEGAIPVLRVLSPIPFLVGLSNVFGVQLMLPLGMKRLFSHILLASAVIDLLLVVPLSWRYGAVGTASAALIAELVVVVSMLITLLRAGVPIFAAARGTVAT